MKMINKLKWHMQRSFIGRLLCKHKPYPFRALNDPDGRVCEKCGKNYRVT